MKPVKLVVREITDGNGTRHGYRASIEEDWSETHADSFPPFVSIELSNFSQIFLRSLAFRLRGSLLSWSATDIDAVLSEVLNKFEILLKEKQAVR